MEQCVESVKSTFKSEGPDLEELERCLLELKSSFSEKKKSEMKKLYSQFLKYGEYFPFIKNTKGLYTEYLHSSIEVLEEIENIILLLDKNYREHFSHQVLVLLLGNYIYSACSEDWISAMAVQQARSLLNILQRSQILEEIPESLHGGMQRYSQRELKNPQIVFSLWLLTALFHDLGYSVLNLDNRINSTIKPIYDKLSIGYKIKPFRIIPTKYTERQKGSFFASVEKLFDKDSAMKLNNIFKQMEKEKDDHGFFGSILSHPPELIKFIRRDIRKIRKQLFSKEATVLHFITLFHTKSGMLDAHLPSSLRKEFHDSFDQLFRNLLFLQLSIAISLHNKGYLFFLSPIQQLLVLSDNLPTREIGSSTGSGLRALNLDYDADQKIFFIEIIYEEISCCIPSWENLKRKFDFREDDGKKTIKTATRKTGQDPDELVCELRQKNCTGKMISTSISIVAETSKRKNECMCVFICGKCGSISFSTSKCASCGT